MTELIDKIIVNGDKSIDITFKYRSPYSVEMKSSTKNIMKETVFL